MRTLSRYLVALFAVFTLSISIHAEDMRKVSLLTCSPGEEVYSLFGHTAIRVYDPAKDIDFVFNYGLFSFNEPNFIWRFVLGETDYLLGVMDFDSFMIEYAMRGSAVTEQIFSLDSIQKNRLIDALFVNANLRNRKYRYNFLYNNCTTKARDKVYEVVVPHYNIVYKLPSIGDSLTFRKIIHVYTSDYPWYELGMDLLLGAKADRVATRGGAQFSPMILKEEISTAVLLDSISERNLISQEEELLAADTRLHSHSNLTPFNVALLLLLFTFVVMLCERRSKKNFFIWDILLMTLQGSAGVLLLFMVLFSKHPAVDENWLLVWLNPLPLFILPILIYKIRQGKTPYVMWIQVVMVSLFIVASPFMPQAFPPALYPCAVALIIRSLFHIYKKDICALD
ncbi:MAG: DUF4105 domain-containing protein [Bacteroidaceae bacterium]|nr:DUF4105 domain-containing protein [Bacteroidaceae bacterium]